MPDLTAIPRKNTTYTYGRDEFGEYGSLIADESEFDVPEPLDFFPTSPFDNTGN